MGNPLTPLPDICAFCGSKDSLTQEHVWADWLKEHLPHLRRGRSNHAISGWRSDPERGTRYQPTMKGRLRHGRSPPMSVLKVVCGLCNNGWMSRLQRRARPVLLPFLAGEWPKLSAQGQRTLASWATMAAMVIEFADMDTIVTPQAHREQFREEHTPPEGWVIWVGRYQDRRWRACFTHHSYSAVLAPSETALPPNACPRAGTCKQLPSWSAVCSSPPSADCRGFRSCFGRKGQALQKPSGSGASGRTFWTPHPRPALCSMTSGQTGLAAPRLLRTNST